jgi:peptide-methionine (S)-S-oxide reductase
MTSIFNRLFSSLKTMSAMPEPVIIPAGSQKAVVAAGCFWGVEHLYRKHFTVAQGLLDARVGYIGGNKKSPSYSSVCSGSTGHAEALLIVFDPEKLSYRTILEFFYRMHDPTTLNRQGGDAGTQYRSAIFTYGEEQAKEAKEITEKVGTEWWKEKVTTQVAEAGEWWDAEAYHQKYLDVNPGGYECPSQ